MWPLKTGSVHMKYSMTGQKKGWPFNRGDSKAGLTVLYIIQVHVLYFMECIQT